MVIHTGKTFSCLAAVMASALSLLAQQPAAAPGVPRVTGAAFRLKTIRVGNVGLNFDNMVGRFFQVRIFNDSDAFVDFNPGDLTIVSAGCALQILEHPLPSETGSLVPTAFRIPPRTFALRSFVAVGTWQAPYQVYFKDQLLAEVTD